jgi:hypothetical protein
MPKKENEINRLEREIYAYCCEKGRELLKRELEVLDEEIREERDRRKYRHKGKRKTVLKTVMGEVEYERALYEEKAEDGSKRYRYLLDEELGFETVGFVSSMLAEKIASVSCELSYRKAAEEISELTGQRISHTGAWNVVQGLGAKLDEKEVYAAKQAKNNEGAGREEARLLFEEQDGVYLNLQGRDRKTLGKSAEMKIAIAYTGAEKTGKNRYNLTGKVACANFEGIDRFYDRKEGVIAGTYNADEIELRVLNGDGANWIKRSLSDDTVHYQLDPFHRNKAVFQCTANPDIRKNLFKLLYSKQTDLLLEVIEAYSNSTEDEKERESFTQLLTYFQNNKDGLVSYKRRGLTLPPAPDGVEYRGCGAMESNVYSIISHRMKRRRANWSIRGGNNLARLLTIKSTGKLSDTLSNLIPSTLPERFAQNIQTTLSASKSPQTVGKGFDGFAKADIPSSMKWLKDLIAIQPI